ncbi:MAG: GNAT family N-acetyltransferase [Clostridia bacterium]|nr:GNAT family N-acetyltransferase [Clostridia bacterium]
MIIEYDKKYDEYIKDLLFELQEYIQNIDLEEYSIASKEFRDLYFLKVMNEIKKYNGKILLYKQENQIAGLVIGLINNDKQENYEFKCPMRGRITELVVTKNLRSKGIGSQLLMAMEKYLNNIGCKDILLGVFAYNERAINFYEKNGYHIRSADMIKCNFQN